MDDSNPTTPFILSRSSSSAAELLQVYPPPSTQSLDDIIHRYVGDFNWKLFLQAVIVSIAWVFDAQQTFISVFTDADPTWHCTSPHGCDSTISNMCDLAKDSWAWDLSKHTSIISEWDLQCANSLISGLPASAFFMGCLIGGILLATLADSWLGRKKMLFFCSITMAMSSLLTTLSTNIWQYSLLKFINGFGRATIGTSALVLSTELVGKKWRGEVGVIGFFFFTFGFLSLPLMAYLNHGNSWKNLYLWTSIPTLLYCVLIYFFVCESPRWLFVRGRKEEAISILKQFAVRAPLPVDPNLITSEPPFVQEYSAGNMNLYSAIKILLERSWSRKRMVTVMIVGFGIGTIYYGMPLGLGNLSFNLYLSATFNALSELPASLVTIFLIGRLSRKISILIFSTMSGICSVLCVVFGKSSMSLEIGLELVSFFSACTAFNILLIYTIELFPTCVRNSAISMVRQALVLGGVISPILVAAARTNGDFWSYGVFGIAIGVCGLFVVGLPDTRDTMFCDTMEEEEYKVMRLTSDFVN
ncbi:hypothetical protein ACFE04_025018 [Oxalis oulophora]